MTATLLRPDAPALVSAYSDAGTGVSDLYFINGTNAGLILLTSHVTAAPPAPFASKTSALFRPLSGSKTALSVKVARSGLLSGAARAQ